MQRVDKAFRLGLFTLLTRERYVGDFMMVTVIRCWWQNDYVGDFVFILLD